MLMPGGIKQSLMPNRLWFCLSILAHLATVKTSDTKGLWESESETQSAVTQLCSGGLIWEQGTNNRSLISGW